MTDKQLTMDEVERILWTDVVMSICGHQPFCWPRHRWTGFDKALQDVGLLACIHGLLEPAYHEFLRLQFGGHKDFAYGGDGDAAEADVEDARGDQGPASFAQTNKANRGKAAAWLETQPAADMFFMRKALQPVMSYLREELAMAGNTWQTVEWARALGNLATSKNYVSIYCRGSGPSSVQPPACWTRNSCKSWRSSMPDGCTPPCLLRGSPSGGGTSFSSYCPGRVAACTSSW